LVCRFFAQQACSPAAAVEICRLSDLQHARVTTSGVAASGRVQQHGVITAKTGLATTASNATIAMMGRNFNISVDSTRARQAKASRVRESFKG
jgi:hypothetical protein